MHIIRSRSNLKRSLPTLLHCYEVAFIFIVITQRQIKVANAFAQPIHNHLKSNRLNSSVVVQGRKMNNDINDSIDQPMPSQISCIRLETKPDPCLKNIESTEKVLKKIKEVRAFQGQYRNAHLYPRRWICTDNPSNKEPKLTSSTPYEFTMMQFNALAEGLSSGPNVTPPLTVENDRKTNEMRDNTFGGFSDLPNPEISLDFTLRRWRIIEVLLGVQIDESIEYLPKEGYFDIMSIQEMDRYYGFFQPILHMFGYESIFVPKQKSPGIKYGWYSDGCALFWKKSSFRLVKEARKSFDVGNQVYIIATLQHLKSSQEIAVATTHLKAQKNIQNEKIRTCQAQQLMQNLLDENKDNIPIILAGDFNSEPYSPENTCIKAVMSQHFSSAYNLNRNDFFTTWKTRGDHTVRRVIDYIFHNCNTVEEMEVTQVLNIPEEDTMEDNKLPGFRFPSDHLSIGAKFRILG